jgi:hypothetical protein
MDKITIKTFGDAERVFLLARTQQQKLSILLMTEQVIRNDEIYLKEMTPLLQQEKSSNSDEINISSILQENLRILRADIELMKAWIEEKTDELT